MELPFGAGIRFTEILFSLPHIGICITDTEGYFIELNDAYSEIFGYSRDELIGEHFSLIIPEELQEEVRQRYRSSFTDSDSVSEEYEAVAKGGKTIYISAASAYFTDEENNGYRVTGVSNATPLVQIRNELDLIKTAFENITEGIVITTTEPKILLVNKAYSKITGYSAEELIGNNPSMMRAGVQDGEYYREMWKDLQKHGSWQGEIWDRRKNGENYAQFLSVSTAYDKEGEPKNYIGVVSDITDLKRFRDKLHYLTNFDPLTRLPNKNLFFDRLQQAITKTKRKQKKLALCLINIDRFNIINQSFSRMIGDDVLRQIAKRFDQTFREADTVGYLGGNTFVLLLEDILLTSSVMKALDKVQKIFERPVPVQNHEIMLTSSVGVSVFPGDGDDSDVLMKNAELAVTLAKREGGNAIQFYSEEMNIEALSRLELENDLRKAIVSEEFFIEYQPQLYLDGKVPFGSEALVRWNHPGKGVVSPGKFIPIAEETGLITDLGQMVLRNACTQYKTWLETGLMPGTLSVNISAIQFARKDFIEAISEILEETAFPPEKLEAEITESTIMGNVEDSIIKLKELKKMGISVAVDDFGTGYSSLSYLKKFPIDKLKIDRSFILDIPHDQDDVIIAATIIQLAHSLRMQVIAEGIETDDQLAFLEENGCDEVQGFYYSKPLSAEHYIEYIRSFA